MKVRYFVTILEHKANTQVTNLIHTRYKQTFCLFLDVINTGDSKTFYSLKRLQNLPILIDTLVAKELTLCDAYARVSTVQGV